MLIMMWFQVTSVVSHLSAISQFLQNATLQDLQFLEKHIRSLRSLIFIFFSYWVTHSAEGPAKESKLSHVVAARLQLWVSKTNHFPGTEHLWVHSYPSETPTHMHTHTGGRIQPPLITIKIVSLDFLKEGSLSCKFAANITGLMHEIWIILLDNRMVKHHLHLYFLLF